MTPEQRAYLLTLAPAQVVDSIRPEPAPTPRWERHHDDYGRHAEKLVVGTTVIGVVVKLPPAAIQLGTHLSNVWLNDRGAKYHTSLADARARLHAAARTELA